MNARFTAAIVRGSGRGKDLGFPTMNLEMTSVPKDLKDGIYACWVSLNSKLTAHGSQLKAAMHYGARPVFKDTPSCEIHLLDGPPPPDVNAVTVTVVRFLRSVADFPSIDALIAQLVKDCDEARRILTTDH